MRVNDRTVSHAISQATTTTAATTPFTTSMSHIPINNQRRDVVLHEHICRDNKVEIDNPTLGPYDVICGRGSNAFNNIGNRRFRVTICLNVQRYIDSPTREEKGVLITSVVALLKSEIGARFFGVKGGKLVELGGTDIRKKVGHALRDTAARHRTLGSFATFQPSFSPVISSPSSSIDHSAREERPLPQEEQHKSDSKLMEDTTNDLLDSFATYWMLIEENPSVSSNEFFPESIKRATPQSPPRKTVDRIITMCDLPDFTAAMRRDQC
jgi:hypothetical protein